MQIKLAENTEELSGILALQALNHKEGLSVEVQRNEGFVTVRHELATLQAMNQELPQVIAVEAGQVIGYALVMARSLKDHIPILKPMFASFERINYQGKPLSQYRYYVMGQVCIERARRGQGIFAQLYDKHKSQYAEQFDFCLTEVSTSNIRSMKAHQKVGFEIIHSFKDATDEWNILLWDWK